MRRDGAGAAGGTYRSPARRPRCGRCRSSGQVRPVWAVLHFHCNRRLHLDDRYISAMYYGRLAPEGGGGDYGSTGGGYDQLGFGALTYAK